MFAKMMHGFEGRSLGDIVNISKNDYFGVLLVFFTQTFDSVNFMYLVSLVLDLVVKI